MPALNITFTEEEMDQIRAATAQEDTSMKTFAHAAVLDAVHRRKVAAAAVQVGRISSGLAKRLAEKQLQETAIIAYLSVEDILTIATINLEAFGEEPKVRDYGLLASAAARPQSGAYGVEAYPTPFEKAAALLHSLASNHALIDGNKRTAWWSAATFLVINDWPLVEPLDEDAAEDLVLAAAQSQIDVPEIAQRLSAFFRYERPV